MNTVELCFTSATELAKLIRSQRLSPVELVDTVLNRIDEVNPIIHAYCTLVPDLAKAAAREAEAAVMRGDNLGPLHGIPISIKDLTPTAGIRTTYGSLIYEHNVPNEDALIVARLKAAGAILLGKTNTPEFGAGINCRNALFPTTLNPWDTSKSPGGSSGGAAAALAAGLGPLAEGSDYGGSLRIPASYCGITAFRTCPGRIPKYPSAWLYDRYAVTGPMARTVEDVALMLSVVAGPDDRVPISLPEPGSMFAEPTRGGVAGLRVAWSRDLGIAAVDPEVAAIFEKAVGTWATIGCQVKQDHPDLHDVMEIIPPLRTVRTAAVYRDILESGDLIKNDFFRDFAERGKKVTALEVGRAEGLESQIWERMAAFFRRYDLLVTPTTQTAAFSVEKLYPEEINGVPITNTIDAVRLTYSISMTGLPAISVPCGFTAAGLPVGMQIIGRRHAEMTVLNAAAAFEEAAPWAHVRPKL